MAKTLREKSVNQILYISIGTMLGILILFIILFNVFNRNSKKQNINLGDNNQSPSMEQASTQIGKSVDEVKKDDTVSENLSVELNEKNETVNLDDNSTAETANTNNENTTDEDANNHEVEIANENSKNNEISDSLETSEYTEKEDEVIADPVFIMPVEGEIVKQYGKEKLIYSSTLKEWTVHLGIDIKADKTSVVKSSSDGVVKSIKNDPRYGLTVVIEHQNGFNSIYSNLLTAEFITVGENVKSGQTIGTVGNTATFEIVDEPHLHFEITKDGENVDPEMYIK